MDNTVSSVAGSYKSVVTKHAHRLGFEMEWHHRFYDHIVRNNKDYDGIPNYIENNTAHWNDDRFNNRSGRATKQKPILYVLLMYICK